MLATNIAETSVTIDDITVVIDGGKHKTKAYDPYTQMSSLRTRWIPQASVKQRAGRAGRVQPGLCYTMMSKKRFDALGTFEVPELLRTPLDELALQVKIIVSSSKNMPSLSIAEFLALAPEPLQKPRRAQWHHFADKD